MLFYEIYRIIWAQERSTFGRYQGGEVKNNEKYDEESGGRRKERQNWIKLGAENTRKRREYQHWCNTSKAY